MKLLNNVLVPSILLIMVLFLNGCKEQTKTNENQIYSCRQCHSVCEINGKPGSFWNVPCIFRYKDKSYDKCNHEWREGVSKSYSSLISDGTIILVQKNGIYGAFKLYNQKLTPESADFKWWYRTDGKGRFDDSSEVKKGDGATQLKSQYANFIRFGPFEIMWSGNTTGKGYVYYSYYQWEKIPADALKICVTSEKEINTIDATDKKWIYKSHVVF